MISRLSSKGALIRELTPRQTISYHQRVYSISQAQPKIRQCSSTQYKLYGEISAIFSPFITLAILEFY